MKQSFFYMILLTFCFTGFASDHIDGPITSEHGVSDLTDLYAFPTPGKSDSLTLILNSYPMMPVKGHFEERLRYVFKIRQAEVVDQQAVTSEEVVVTCQFKAPHHKEKNKAFCSTENGLLIDGQLNMINESSGVKMWAGMRSDPFFFNSDWALSASIEGKILKPKNENIMDQLNVLSLVLEFDPDQLFSSGSSTSLYAVVAEVYFVDYSTRDEKLLDRIGRPEITNVSLVANNSERDLRDEYNSEDSFNLGSAARADYINRLFLNIGYYDSLDDGLIEWSENEKTIFAKILVDDFLLVDIGKDCDDSSFLAIELAMLAKKSYDSCGGRKINDDIMDVMFSLFINKGSEHLRDGVDKPYREVSSEFPYLAEPDTSKIARIKAFLARQFAKP